MAKLNKFATNVNAAKNGVAVDLGEGLVVTIARSGNENYQKYLKQALKPYEKMLRTKTLPDQTFELIYTEAVAETILLGWKGLEDENGVEIPYTKEKAIEILSDPQYIDFRTLILDLAGEAAVFAKEAVEDTKAA